MRFSVLLAGLAVVSAPVAAEREVRPLAEATLMDAGGSRVGTARILPRSTGVVLEVEARGMTPGPHGMHLHAVGQCNGADFANAGGHLNPDGHEHGVNNPNGSHLGDLPNVTASPEGWIKASIRTDMRPFKLIQEIFDGDGTALVIHEGADDYRTDPSGNSGKRVVCGVFERP